MQKAAIMLIITGALVAAGLGLVVFGTQAVLEGVSQGDGMVSRSEPLVIEAEFDADDTDTGVFVVQIPEFEGDTFSASVIGPSDTELASQNVDADTIEKEFDIVQSGTYRLVIESSSGEDAAAIGAIGPLPDAADKSIGFLAIYVLIVGMAGLAVTGIVAIRGKKRSV